MKSNVRQMNWTLLDQMVVSGSNFLFTIIIAKHLGLANFGSFSLIWLAILLLLSAQYALFSTSLMTKGAVKSHDELAQYVTSTLALQILFPIPLCIILSLFIWAFHSFSVFTPFDANYGIICCALFAKGLQDFIRRYFFVTKRANHAFVNDLICCGLLLVGSVVYSLHFVASINEVFIIIAVAYGFGCVSAIYLASELKFENIQLNNRLKECWCDSKWLFYSAILNWLSANFSIFVSSLLLNISVIGALRAVQNIMGLLNVMFQAVENFVPQQAARRNVQQGKKGLSRYLACLSMYGGMATLLIVMLCIWFSEEILSLFYTQDYSQYASIVNWYAVIYILSFLTLPLMAGLRVLEQTKSIFRALVWVSGINICVTFPLCLYFGVSGALFSMLVAKLGMLMMLYLYYKRANNQLDKVTIG